LLVKVTSVVGFAAMVFAAAGLLMIHSLFGRSPWAIAIQAGAIALMIWARVTFGLRSFHAAANPTAGRLVTSGPYRFLRHPIYASIIFFVWAGALDHFSAPSVVFALIATAGGIIRMFCEERLLLQDYPEYRVYMGRTKRLLPCLW
jgi:protein-S-isoprenylcysteine O-methyltransferase Ste14